MIKSIFVLSFAATVACTFSACGGAELLSTPGATQDDAGAVGAAPPAASAPSTRRAAVSITAFGAVCNGRTDDSRAIERAIAAAKTQNLAVSIPDGVCAYGDVIRLDGVKMYGNGDTSVLYALNPSREAIFMSGDGVAVSQVRLAGVRARVRQAAWEATRITLFGARNFVVRSVTIEGSAAAGIQTARAATLGVISDNRIKDTLADSIHITDRASQVQIDGNHIENSGDDGIAVVSYQTDGGVVNHITARNNVIVNNRWGRQMSVVGGSDVLYENNALENNLASAACLYVAQEASYATRGASNVTLRHNTLKNCGGTRTGHGAVMLFSDGQEANTNVTIRRNDIQQSHTGIRIYGARNASITVDSNRVSGAAEATSIGTPGVAVTPYTSGEVGVQPR